MRLLVVARAAMGILAILADGSVLAATEVAEAPILTSSFERALQRASAALDSPILPLRAGEALILLEPSGASVRVTVVGSPSGDVKRLAAALDAWAARQPFRATTTYAAEELGTVAQMRYNVRQFGAWDLETRFRPEGLRRAVGEVEPKTHVLMLVPSWSVPDFGGVAPRRISRATVGWDLSSKRPLPEMTARVTVPVWMTFVFVLWLVLMPVGFLTLSYLAIRDAKREDTALEVRRRRYGRWITQGTIAVIGAHGLLAAATLPSRALEPIAHAWLGLRFTQIAMVAIGVGLLPIMMMRPYLARVEMTVLGPTPEELASVGHQPLSPELVPIPQWRKVVGASLLTGGAILVIAGMFPSGSGRSLSFLILVGGGLMLAGFVIQGLASAAKRAEPFDAATLQQLQASVHEVVANVAQRLEIAPPEVRLGEVGTAPIATSKWIRISSLAVAESTVPELTFLVARELWPLKRRHRQWRLAVAMIPIGFLVAVALSVALVPTLSRIYGFLIIFVQIIVAVFVTLVMPMFVRTQDYAADRLALQTTRDVRAAITVTEKMAEERKVDALARRAVNRRIQRLRAHGEKLGLDVPPIVQPPGG